VKQQKPPKLCPMMPAAVRGFFVFSFRFFQVKKKLRPVLRCGVVSE
jgi:hypothetical protein